MLATELVYPISARIFFIHKDKQWRKIISEGPNIERTV